MSSLSSVLTQGLGNWGSPSLLITLGYGEEEVIIASQPPYPVIEGTYNSYIVLHGSPLIRLDSSPTNYSVIRGTPTVTLEGPSNNYTVLR